MNEPLAVLRPVSTRRFPCHSSTVRCATHDRSEDLSSPDSLDFEVRSRLMRTETDLRVEPSPLNVPDPLDVPDPVEVPDPLDVPEPVEVPDPLEDPDPVEVPEPLEPLGGAADVVVAVQCNVPVEHPSPDDDPATPMSKVPETDCGPSKDP